MTNIEDSNRRSVGFAHQFPRNVTLQVSQLPRAIYPRELQNVSSLLVPV